MCFWGATVITSLASAFPVVGNPLVTWLWGGLSVENATLNRFLSLHYLLPFILACHSILRGNRLYGNPIHLEREVGAGVGWTVYPPLSTGSVASPHRE